MRIFVISIAVFIFQIPQCFAGKFCDYTVSPPQCQDWPVSASVGKFGLDDYTVSLKQVPPRQFPDVLRQLEIGRSGLAIDTKKLTKDTTKNTGFDVDLTNLPKANAQVLIDSLPVTAKIPK